MPVFGKSLTWLLIVRPVIISVYEKWFKYAGAIFSADDQETSAEISYWSIYLRPNKFFIETYIDVS